MPAVPRARRDGCPGALQVHEAADGGLARIRIPGGWLTTEQWTVLQRAAAELGDGRLELTSRGNVQIRALDKNNDLAERLAQIGLLPSATHERVRNIVASPLGGDRIRDAANHLDKALCAVPELADLPGRFLFGIDDGSGDIAALDADVVAFATSRETFTILLAGADYGIRVAADDVVPTLLEVANGFQQARQCEWRLKELDVPEFASQFARTHQRITIEAPANPVGPVEQHDGRVALCVVAPIGRLTAEQARLLGAVAPTGQLAITPWRGVIVPDLPRADIPGVAAELDLAGLILDPGSPWVGVSACTGTPGCARSHADVQRDAHRPENSHARKVHWSGCERRCGHPAGRYVDVLATPTGYVVTGE
jgi:precorrin-3B synthase